MATATVDTTKKDEALAAVTAARATAKSADALFVAAVVKAQKAGASYAEIGAAAGLTRSRAHQIATMKG